MHAFIAKAKSRLFMVVAGVLLLGLVAGLNMQPNNKAQAHADRGTDYFLKIDGIEGESTDNQHRGEIELQSFSGGLSQAARAGGGGGGAGKVQLQDFHFTQRVSKASPKLMEAVASGKHFKEATLTVRKAGGKQQQEYMIVKMTDVLVSSYQLAGQNQEAPSDEFSLNFTKVEYRYSPQKADGSLDAPVIGSWDFVKNQDL